MVQTRSQKAKLEASRPQLIIKLRYRPIKPATRARRSERIQKASSSSLQKTISGRITKSTQIQQASTKVVAVKTENELDRPVKRRSRSLRVRLGSVDYSQLPAYIQQLDYKIVRARKRQANFSGRYLPPLPNQHSNRYAFVFGHNPFGHTDFQGPTVERQWDVYNLMKKDLKENFNKDCFLDQPDATTNELQAGPMHMSEDLTVDNLVKVILSISTENSLAIRQHAQLCSKFTYTVNGSEVKGTIPNYHKMRVCSPEELVKALNIAGYQNMRQKAFHTILSEIYEQNVKQMAPWEVVPEGNAAGALDFVPGLLSMDYLKGDGLSKQERFELLVKFDQIAVKTGCCLLAFNLKIPVFVVDTHVHHMTRNLQWIPEDCYDADKACMFLDKIMPEHLKFGLHQAFWHHRINCARCMPRANPKSLVYQQRICPLEHLIKRDLQPMNRAVVQQDKGNKATKPKRKGETPKDRKKPGSVAFLNIHYKIAVEQGYALRRIEIDDNFGDGSRQNKSAQANYYWGRKEFTHIDDIVEIKEALVAVGMSIEDYEARFVKKVRVKKQKNLIRRKIVKGTDQDSDTDVDDEMKVEDGSDNEVGGDQNNNDGQNHDDNDQDDDGDDGDDGVHSDSTLTDIDDLEALIDHDIDMADAV